MPRTAIFALLGILYWTTHSMLRPLVGTYVLSMGGSETEASIALASYSIFPTLLAILIGAVADRWGNRRLLISGAVLMVCGATLLWIPSLGTVIASQVIVGLGTLSVWVSLQTFATRSQDPAETRDQRTSRIATFSLFVAAGQSIGPALGGGLQSLGGYALAFGCYVGLAFVLTCCAFAFAPRDPAARPDEGRSLIRAYPDAVVLLRNPAVLATVAASFTSLVIFDIRSAWMPVLLHGAGLAQWQIGVILSAGALAGFAARPFFAPVLRLLRPPIMVASVMLVAAAASTCVVIAPHSFAFVATMSAISGFAVGFAQPLTLTLLADETPTTQLGLASGLRTMANQSAQLASPAAFGVVTAISSLGAAFVVVGALAAGAGLTSAIVLAVPRHRRAPEPVAPERSIELQPATES